MKRDLACGILMLALAIAYYAVAAAIPRSTLADAVGPQGLPTSYAIVLGILSLLLIANTLLGRGGGIHAVVSVAKKTGKSDRYAAMRAIGMLALGAAYVALLPYLGYILTLGLLILSVAWYLERRLTPWMLPIAAAGGVVFWLIFVEILQVPQPGGLWPSLI
jgi:putative tricarboxylic transport membrane protein